MAATTPVLSSLQPSSPLLTGNTAKVRAWRGTPADLMAIVERMRVLMRSQVERALAIGGAQIETLFDQQIDDARRTQPPANLPTALDTLMKAKVDAKQNLLKQVFGQSG